MDDLIKRHDEFVGRKDITYGHAVGLSITFLLNEISKLRAELLVVSANADRGAEMYNTHGLLLTSSYAESSTDTLYSSPALGSDHDQILTKG